MATVYRSGSSGSGVKTLQENLNAAGYEPALSTDGKFGPKTKAAVEWYQKEHDLTVDGIAGSQTLGSLGQTASPGAGTPSDPGDGSPLTDLEDYTDPEETRFNGLPGKPEVWKEEGTGKIYVVYYVPGSEPPIPLLYSVPSESDLESFFGDRDVVYDREISTEDIDSFGSVRWGTTDSIPMTGGDPWTGFTEEFDRAKKTQPWLNDPEVFAVFTAAWLQGREPEKWELEGTEWWQSKTEAQQEWAWLAARNPAEADSLLEDNYLKVYNAFVELGLDNVNEEIVTMMANEFTMGNWSPTKLAEQIDRLYNPESGIDMDEGLASLIEDGELELGTPSLGTPDVKGEWDKWLGPAYPPTDEQVASWAAKIRKGGQGAKDMLTEELRRQRMALFPEYDNPDLTYQDIAAPWRGFVTNSWGQTPDESSDMFQEVIRLNDTSEAGKLVRREGMSQGIGQVEQSALTGLQDQTSQVRRAI